MSESNRVESVSKWYTQEQLHFDRCLIRYRYETWKPYLTGPEGLELGCGDGQMTRLLAGHFSRLTVVEGSAELLAVIPEAVSLVKVHSLFEDFHPAGKFNTIFMEHILEHIEHPGDLLVRAQGWLGAKGRILIGVPNGNSFHRLAAVKMGLLADPCQLNARDISVGHRRVFTSQSLRTLMERSGLEVEKMGGVFFKPLSNQQIQDQWTEAMIEGFYELGKDFPENAAELYAVCRAR
jgi:2-polyprenyl-3-methyl-5-hydroxy-6-metoxy-1,4-benzoquinol methylase